MGAGKENSESNPGPRRKAFAVGGVPTNDGFLNATLFITCPAIAKNRGVAEDGSP